MRVKISPIILFCCIIFQSVGVFAQDDEFSDRRGMWTKSQISEAERLKVFNNLWETINRLYFDSKFNGYDLAKLREFYLPQAIKASNKIELAKVLKDFVGELKTSHLDISLETSFRGKTLDKMFGNGTDYKNNTIPFGYGYALHKIGGQNMVTEVVKNTNAEKVGLQAGWIEKSCERHPLTKTIDDSLVFTEIADCVFITESGLEKRLTFNQEWFLKPRSKTQRVSKRLDDTILYLKFTDFYDGSDKWLKEQVKNNFAAKAIIVDLRRNNGGSVEEVQDALSVFFPAETIIGEFIERDTGKKVLRVGSNIPFRGQIIVLTDGNTYSGAEIFAAAVQELERGKIIGEKSGGQVLAATEKSLSNGFNIRIAFRDYRTIKGVRLENRGVMPDIEIPLSVENFRLQKDVVLEKTLEILNKH